MSPKPKRPVLFSAEFDCHVVVLTKGGFALIDEADVPYVSRFNWSTMANGYAMRSTRHTGKFLLHREIIQQFTEIPPTHIVDHISGDRLDCRRSNLRTGSVSQNGMNSKKRKDNKSGFRGVSWVARDSDWAAFITLGGKSVRLGSFATPEEASACYEEVAKANFGEFKRKPENY